MYAIQPSIERVEFPSYARTFATMHDAMRRDARRLVGAVDTIDAVDTGPDAGLPKLARWFDRFEAVIEHHHHCEDEIVWPGLDAIVARGHCGDEGEAFRAARLALLDDHEQLDDAMRGVQSSLRDVSTIEVRRDAARRFQEGLDRHLTSEEAALFPLLLHHISEEEFLELEEQVVEVTPFTALTFTVPWVIDGAPADVVADIVSGLPLPIRLANRWFLQPRYRRLVERATGAATEGRRS